MAGLDDDGKTAASLTQTVASSWYVTGKIFVWLDPADSVTTGSAPTVVGGLGPSIAVTQTLGQNSTGANQTLDYTVEVRRALTVTGTVVSQAGSSTVTWSQKLSYSNTGNITDFGVGQVNNFDTQGSDQSSGAAAYSYGSDYQFPLFCNTTTDTSPQGNLTLWAHLRQGLQLQVTGAAVFPTGLEAFAAKRSYSGGSLLSTTVEGTATFTQTGDGKSSSSWGTTNQVFHFGGISGAGVLGASPDVELYFRNATATNDTLVSNREVVGGGRPASDFDSLPPPPDLLLLPGLFAQAPTVGAGTGPPRLSRSRRPRSGRGG